MTASRILSTLFQVKSAAKNQGKLFSMVSFGLAQTKNDADLQTIERLYENHHRLVYRLCFRMTQNIEIAEDLTQRVFVRLFKQLKKCAEKSDLNEQILPLAIDELLCYFLRIDERFNYSKDWSFGKFHKSFEKQTAKTAFDRYCTIENAISRLPIDYRLIFLLHDCEHFTHAEIARILKIDVETSRLNLHEARTNLRRQLFN